MTMKAYLKRGGISFLALALAGTFAPAAVSAQDDQSLVESSRGERPPSARQERRPVFRDQDRAVRAQSEDVREARQEAVRRAVEARRERQTQSDSSGTARQQAEIDRRLAERGIDRDNPQRDVRPTFRDDARNGSYADPARDRTYRDGRRDREGRRDGWRDDRRDSRDERVQNYLRRNAERTGDRRDGWGRNDWDRRDWDRRDWDRRDWDRRWGHHDRWSHYDRWDRHGWRADRRYDWHRHRSLNRHLFSPGRYYAPGRGYSYNRLRVGLRLGSPFFGSRYAINDPWRYRLPEVYGPYRWVRYYDDVVLVDLRDGEVVDVIYNFFW